MDNMWATNSHVGGKRLNQFDQYINKVKDFPKKGVLFYDINPLLNEPDVRNLAIYELYQSVERLEVNKVVCIDARGFILGALIADRLGVGLVPIRKQGKLPGEIIKCSYNLEYGQNSVEIQKSAIKQGERIIIVDDVLATGGTALVAKSLVERLGGKIIKFLFLIEIKSLEGYKKLDNIPIYSLIQY